MQCGPIKDEWCSPCGSVRLILGDCLEVLPTLEAGSVDCVVTDPQYGISEIASDFTRIANKGTRRYEFFENDGHYAATVLAERALLCAIPSCSSSASVYVFCAHKQFGNIVALLENNQFKTRFVIWNKPCPCPAPPGSGWPAGAELCVYGYRKCRIWNPRPGDAPKSNVLTYDSYRHGQPGKVDHPTQKPLGLFQELIEYSTRPGHLVADWFMGSGTTGVACVRTGRRFIGIEIEPKYYAIARKRIIDELNRHPLFDAPTSHQDQRELFGEGTT